MNSTEPRYRLFVEIRGGLPIDRGAVIEETPAGTVFEFECVHVSVGETYLTLDLGESGLHINHGDIRFWREYRIDDD